MGNAAGGIEQADDREAKHSVGSGTGLSDPTPTLQKKQPAPPKLPVPPEDELEERFSVVLSYMNLPPDKLKLLSQYDNDKKWELICDQERFQVKNPPSTYLTKIKSFYQDQGGVTRRFKRRVQESTQVLRELEISLRTNHIGWAQEFLNEENQGLDVLVDYLSYAQCDASFDLEGAENGGTLSERGKPAERSMEDLNKSAGSSPTHGMTRAARALTVRITSLAQSRRTQKISRLASQRDDVHVCIMCLRAIMNYQSGFNQVMTHPRCVNEITLSLNNKNPRTKALVLELLAAVCLVRDGHDIILAAFDNLKEVSGEKNRFEKLMEYFSNDDSNIDFMVACMQFINIVVHSVENMNFRVHLQYEFTHHGLDQYLESLKLTESEKLQVQIQAYLDNVFDVGALLEDAENRGGVLEHVDELREHNSQLSARLEEIESQSAERMAELEKQLLQATKETELLKESLRDSCSQVSSLQQREREREMSQERERDRERLSQPSSELELKVQELQDRGLIRLGRTPSGALDLQVVPVTIIEYAPAPASEPLLSSTGPTAPGLDVPDATPFSAISSETPTSITCVYQWRLPRGGRLIIMSGTERMEWHQTCGNHVLDVFDTIPPIPLQGEIMNIEERLKRLGCERSNRRELYANQIVSQSHEFVYTKFRMPLLNWQALKPNQVTGTVFHELDDEQVLGVRPNLHTDTMRISDPLFLSCVCVSVSLDSILQDIRSLERGMEVTKKEFLVQEDNTVLKDFVKTNSELLDSLLKDSKTAQEAYGSVVEYFGENPKTTQPSMFFPPFVRFMKAYKQAEKDNEKKKRLEAQSGEIQAESPSPRKKEAAGHKSPMMPKMDLIAELKKRQVKPQVKDGALEDIITDLRNSPFRATDGRRPAQRQDT
ncbi:unnamed protein product [Oncorhynchus mykiss]|uniref:GBD/FH3 domain-containing protein n=1 Tax=Oncorhynchus mykiss TaxID=8022 RepID=A0A060Y669_ONCMY|nr:unnamed protein product [Oncorhynchus mykiss]